MQSRVLRVLNLASFQGNIGDNANHQGFRRIFTACIDRPVEFTDLEIREFYRKKRSYDDTFVEYVNRFDLFIIGGGNYFELWPTNSPTGTSIGLSIDQIRRMRCPILFHALGVDIGQGIGDGSKQKFQDFLDFCLDNPNIRVSVRNDGAADNLKAVYSDRYAGRVPTVPDGGFLVSNRSVSDSTPDRRRWIGINVAADMDSIRYKRFGLSKFMDDIRSLVTWLARQSYTSVFIPHIPGDLFLVSDILRELRDDKILRENVIVAPLEQGIEGLQSAMSYYARCTQILATRFHSNVLGMVLQVPTIGLNSYIQIPGLYREIGLESQLVNVNDEFFLERIQEKILENESNTAQARLRIHYEKMILEMEKNAIEYAIDIKQWLELCEKRTTRTDSREVGLT